MYKLYCGGSFDFDYKSSDYKVKAARDYRAIILGNTDLLLQKHDYISLGNNLQYIGPFYFETKDMIDRDIVTAEINMIESCTHAIFLLDKANCPGTVAELMLASKFKKKIEIFYIKHSNDEETESELHTPCWFPIIMSLIINIETHITTCNDYEDAVNKISSYLHCLI